MRGFLGSGNDDRALTLIAVGLSTLGFLPQYRYFSLIAIFVWVAPSVAKRLESPRVQAIFDHFTLAEDSPSKEISVFALLALLLSTFVDIWIGTFTTSDLAAKAGFLVQLTAVSVAIMALFAFLAYVKFDEQIYSINKSVNWQAIGVGVMSFTALVLIQAFVTSFVSPNTSLSAINIQVNSSLSSVFYESSAINETFLFQGVYYTIIAKVISGVDEEVGWKEFVIAGLFVVPVMAGFLHFAVYAASATAIVSIALSFAFLNFLFELTDSLDTPLVAHMSLNLASSLVASIYTLSLGGTNIVPMLPAIIAFGMIPLLFYVARRKGWLAKRDARRALRKIQVSQNPRNQRINSVLDNAPVA